MSSPIAVFPGTFDPITIGHVSIVQRALPLFGKVIVGMGVNTTKQTMFDVEQRLAWIRHAFAGDARVEAMAFEGLTVDIALMNRHLSEVETIFLPSAPEHAHISSTIVRELIANKADVSALVPMDLRPTR